MAPDALWAEVQTFQHGPSAPDPPACPACHLAYGTGLAAMYCPSIRHTDGPLEITFIPQNQLRQPCGSGSLVGLFSSWRCPFLSSQSVFRRPLSWPYHSEMPELDSLSAPGPKCPALFILASPGSTSLLSALPGHCWGSVNFGWENALL